MERKIAILGALAITCLTLLFTLSCLEPTPITNFSEIPREDGRYIIILCEVSNVREAKGGWILELSDFYSHTIRAFCGSSIIDEAPNPGTVIFAGADVSDNGEFLFLKSIEIYKNQYDATF
ncbi:MAG: hypothetical protein QXN93_02140 [Methanomassiliicoccales archaeon]